MAVLRRQGQALQFLPIQKPHGPGAPFDSFEEANDTEEKPAGFARKRKTDRRKTIRME